ncbi:MAG TPA: nitroreductase family protein [Thermomicrobiales bacterium]
MLVSEVVPHLFDPLVDAQDATLVRLLASRRSIRRLRPGPLAPATLERIVAAAQLTPAAFNRPSWHLVVVHERRAELWAELEAAFRERLEGERLSRYLDRLEGFRQGIGALLLYEDRAAVEAMRAANQIDEERARAYSEQALGMVQLALWLALTDEGLATSLQHWEALAGDRLAAFLGLPADRYRLVATMPFGYPAEEPRPVERPDPNRVVSIESFTPVGDGESAPSRVASASRLAS